MNNKLLIGVAIVAVIGASAYFFAKKDEAPIQSSQSNTNVTTAPGYQGQLLAGLSSPYLAFTKTDYDKALAENKIIFLDFYANWCPICRAETPVLQEGFNGLKTDKIIGFRVNFNDTETDSDEKALAKQFSVPYQHFKVILKDGKTVLTDADSWDTQTFATKINSVLQ